jgi:arsenite methyltransferase
MAVSLADADDDAFRSSVSDYYGVTLQSTADLKTSACCPVGSAPAEHRAILAKIHPEVRDRFYGCGSPIPDYLSGATVLDLGCGTGRDVYLASALVGKAGKVVGIDMTDNQLEVARRHQAYHAEALHGPGEPSNVEFRKGVIEDLAAACVEDDSVDVVISNCVCNLSPDKPAVFREVARVLRTGGEFYFSDIYADRRLSSEAQADPVLVGECLGGALYIQDFRRALAAAGLPDVRIVSCAPVILHDPTLTSLVPNVNFYSITIRAFKIPGLEDRAESYGQTATYISCCGSGLKLDATHNFPRGVPVPVDANTAAILTISRYARRFSVSPPGPHEGLANSSLEGGTIAALMNADSRGTSTACCPPAAVPLAAEACCPPSTPKDNPPASTSRCFVPAAPQEESGSSCCSPAASEEALTSVSGGCCPPPVALNKVMSSASGSACRLPATAKDVPASASGGNCCPPVAPAPVVVKQANSGCCNPAAKAPGGCC